MREKGFSVSILDPQAEERTFDETAREALRHHPKLIAVIVYGHQPSASTQHITLQALLNEFHTAVWNLDDVSNSRGWDRFPTPEVGKVPDLWYWENGQIKFTFAVPLIQNLDEELSDIAWDLLPRYKYRAHNWHCFGGIPRAGNFGFTELSIVNGPICY